MNGVPSACVDAYADDNSATAATPETIQHVLNLTGEFAKATRQTIDFVAHVMEGVKHG